MCSEDTSIAAQIALRHQVLELYQTAFSTGRVHPPRTVPPGPPPAKSVVVAKLSDEQRIGLNFIDHAMLIRDAP